MKKHAKYSDSQWGMEREKQKVLEYETLIKGKMTLWLLECPICPYPQFNNVYQNNCSY